MSDRYAVLGYASKRRDGGHYWNIFARGLRRKKAERVMAMYQNGVRGVAYCGLHIEPDAVADDEDAARRYWDWMVEFAEGAFQ